MSKKFRGAHYVLCIGLLLGLTGGLLGGNLALAADEEPAPKAPVIESLEVYSRFPVLQNTAGSSFEFEVTLYYEGSEARTFDLDLVLPDGWAGIFMGGYPETEISAFTVEPAKEREAIYLIVAPDGQNVPEPGEYTFTVRAFSGELADSIDLKAEVIPPPPQYLLYLTTSTLLREFSVKPNEPNHISLQLTNAQIGTVTDIEFSAEVPEGWDLTFTPASLNTLESGVTQEIDTVIIPPAGTAAGDYPFNVKVTGNESEAERELRLTVVTGTNVGAAGIGAAVAIIVGLAIWFRRAGKR
jgi:uncharacterized membrane protein